MGEAAACSSERLPLEAFESSITNTAFALLAGAANTLAAEFNAVANDGYDPQQYSNRFARKVASPLPVSAAQQQPLSLAGQPPLPRCPAGERVFTVIFISSVPVPDCLILGPERFP